MKAILINGPMGVGKTTVGKYIAERYPGTAFIDGDWCMDLHPFVGSRETRAMAVDNILHLAGNYRKCSVCRMIVVVWLMDDPQVVRAVAEGLSGLQRAAQHPLSRWTFRPAVGCKKRDADLRQGRADPQMEKRSRLRVADG